MPELNYKASNIAKAEIALDANFFETLLGINDEVPSVREILMILMAGGLTEQEADDLLDSKGIEEAMRLAAEAIVRAGFLPKAKATTNSQKSQK